MMRRIVGIASLVILSTALVGCRSERLARPAGEAPSPLQVSERSVINDRSTSLLADLPVEGCDAKDPAAVVVVPSEPVMVTMIEHDPKDIELGFKVEFVPGRLNLGGGSPSSNDIEDEMAAGSLVLDVRPIHVAREIAVLEHASRIDLAAAEPTAFTAKARGIEWPGLHRAAVCLSVRRSAANGGQVLATKTVGMAVDVRTKPRLVALQPEIELNLVNCWGIGCWLAEAIVPDATAVDRWPIEIRNDSLATVAIEPQTRLRRNAQEAAWPLFALEPAPEQAPHLGVGARGRYLLDIRRRGLGAGSYTGDLAFIAWPEAEGPWTDKEGERGVVRNRTETLVKTTVNVRAGILVPILVLILGIVAGRLNQQISTPEAQARLKLMDRWFDLDKDVRGLREGSWWRLFSEDRRKELRLDLDDPSVDNVTLGGDIARLERQVGLFGRLEAAERSGGVTGTAKALITEIRGLVRSAEFAEVKKKLQELETLLVEDSSEMPDHQFEALEREMKGAAELTAEALRADKYPVTKELPLGFARVMAWLAGTKVASLRVRYLYFQPIATFLLLVSLVALGLVTFYTGSDHSTFGAALIDDYLPLFLWGFGSDILAKRLTNISLTPKAGGVD